MVSFVLIINEQPMIRRDLRISSLIVKEQFDTLSDDEQRELVAWKSSHTHLYEKLHNFDHAGEHVDKLNQFSADDAWNILNSHIVRSNRRRRFAVAAAVLLPILIISTFCLTYNFNDVPAPVYAEVETLRGESMTIELPDGTKVQLNSMSRLVYPDTFVGDERRVQLEGEAFFDVTKSDIPFIVSTPLMDIQVLGTVFNVSAYSGEEASAVLVEGSIKVTSGEEAGCVLTPGMMATITDDSDDIKVEHVDTQFYTSWTKGRIDFRDERLEDIMTTLSHWYDFEVKYANDAVKDLRFGCSVNRYETIEPFIDHMVKTGKVSVKKNNNCYLFINN